MYGVYYGIPYIPGHSKHVYDRSGSGIHVFAGSAVAASGLAFATSSLAFATSGLAFATSGLAFAASGLAFAALGWPLATSASRVDEAEGASERRFWAGGEFDSAGIWEANAAAGQDLRFFSFFAGSTIQRKKRISIY